MFCESFGTQSKMVAFISRFDLRKGQNKVKPGQKRSNFQNQIFLTKTCLSRLVLSQDQKRVIYFYVRQLEMPEIAFQKVTSSPLPVSYQCMVKIKILLCYLVCVLFVCSFTTYGSVFWITPKFWIL